MQIKSPKTENLKIAIIGLGYVGLPLAIEFDKYFDTTGYDINKNRINELKIGIDKTRGNIKDELLKSKIKFSYDKADLKLNDIYIITVPTPVNKFNNPDFYFVEEACKLIAKYLVKGNIVIFESTVYPGATREICIPILEKISQYEIEY